MKFKPLVLLLIFLIWSEIAQSASASPWTTGQKKLLYIRVDFADNTGEPVSLQKAQTEMGDLARFFYDNSYGKIKLSWYITPLLRLPHTYVEYEHMGDETRGQLRKDGTAVARLAGFDADKFDFYLVHYRKSSHQTIPTAVINTTDNRGVIGKAGILTKTPTGAAIAHELGHNLGLTHEHAGIWQTYTESSIGPGERISNRNPFDLMAHVVNVKTAWNSHFNSRAKLFLDWIDKSNVLRVEKSGTYTIQAHDIPALKGLCALEIPLPPAGSLPIELSKTGKKEKRPIRKSYWIDARQLFPQNVFASNGVLVYWSYSNGKTDLLDMTPRSASGMEDAPLTIGRTFADPQSGIFITPLRRDQGNPATVDVHIELSPADNRPPLLKIEGDTNVFIGKKTTFRTVTSDPNGDELVYYWEFNDGIFSLESQPLVERTYWRPGDYSVRCIVSDRKGGTAEATFRFTVK